MDIAIITGAHQGYGLAIARRLVDMGMQVCAIGPHFNSESFNHPDYHPMAVDMTDPAAAASVMDSLKTGDGRIHCLIHAAELDSTGSFESMPPEEIPARIHHGLTFPLTLLRLALPGLIKQRGQVVTLQRTATASAFSPLDEALNGVWSRLNERLFQQIRDTGVRMTRIQIDQTFGPEANAEAVENILRFPEGSLVSELVLRPQATREEPKIARTFSPILQAAREVRLPEPQNFPESSGPIATPLPRRPGPGERPPMEIEAEEDDDDDEIEPELRYLIREPYQESHSAPRAAQTGSGGGERPESGNGPRRKRSRRRGRGRDRDRGRNPDQGREENPKPVSTDDKPAPTIAPKTDQPVTAVAMDKPVNPSPRNEEEPSPASQKPQRPARKIPARTDSSGEKAEPKPVVKKTVDTSSAKDESEAKPKPRGRKPSRKPPPSAPGGPGRDD
jgi:NAD(P)-dependent dehydrogenase (short-subunit alcohol dehydrogenase family)